MESTTLLNNRYRLLSQVAAGGMAVVYKAQDTLLNRVVAVKILREFFAADPTFQARFRREAEAAANLNHVNVVTVYDVGHDAGRHYIVMEYVDGQDLKQIIRAEAPLPIQRAVEIAIQICAALGAAHRAGLVHCDVKPQNVLITADGRVKVTDFGIARALSQASTAITDTVWGTPHYISPEQAAGESPTPASDVYAAGVIMYEMLTGRLPFEGETHTQLALAHMRDEPPPLTLLNPTVPAQVDRIVSKVMSKEPSARYRTADQLATVLIEYRNLAEQATGYQPATRPPPIGPTVARRPIRETPPTGQADGFDWLGWLLGGLAAVAVLGLIILWIFVARAYSVPAPIVTPQPAVTTASGSTSPSAANGQVPVPRVVGLTRDQAVMRLDEAGLRAVDGAQQFSGDVPAGIVMQQMPASGELAPRNSIVQIVVSSGPQVSAVPNVTGLMYNPDIEAGLKQNGWDVWTEEQYSQKPYHEILAMTPPPFTLLRAGEPLTLTLSGGITLTMEAQFADLIQLDNVLLPVAEVRRGESLEMTFLWRALDRISMPYVRFIHFVDADGQIQTQADAEPSPPTTAWARNVVIRDQYFLPIPGDVLPGEHQLLVGYYPVGSPFTRLPISDPGKSQDVDQRLLVYTVTVLP